MAKSEFTRKNITENMDIILFDEVDGICPKCNKPLMNQTGTRKTKLYEVAHIYPHSPRQNEIALLKDEVRLSDDAEHIDNLIALCRDCHKIFDNPRTVDGYREMVAIKKTYQQLSKRKNEWFYNSLDEELSKVIESLKFLSSEALEALEELSLDAIKIDNKTDSTLNNLVKLKIKQNVKYFYSKIKQQFAEMDKGAPYTSDAIYSQVKTYYVKLKKDGLDQTQIFAALTAWINATGKCGSTEVSEILVSFFVQNCEVFSDHS